MPLCGQATLSTIPKTFFLFFSLLSQKKVARSCLVWANTIALGSGARSPVGRSQSEARPCKLGRHHATHQRPSAQRPVCAFFKKEKTNILLIGTLFCATKKEQKCVRARDRFGREARQHSHKGKEKIKLAKEK